MKINLKLKTPFLKMGYVDFGDFNSREEVFKEMKKICKDKGVEVYYMRSWIEADGTEVIDFGSHSEFFNIKEV